MATEKRLIDANDLLESELWGYLKDGYEKASARIIVQSCPTVDAVEMVRCGKCRYCIDGACLHYKNRVAVKVPDFGKRYSYIANLKVTEDHFCSYGERREEE